MQKGQFPKHSLSHGSKAAFEQSTCVIQICPRCFNSNYISIRSLTSLLVIKYVIPSRAAIQYLYIPITRDEACSCSPDSSRALLKDQPHLSRGMWSFGERILAERLPTSSSLFYCFSNMPEAKGTLLSNSIPLHGAPMEKHAS